MQIISVYGKESADTRRYLPQCRIKSLVFELPFFSFRTNGTLLSSDWSKYPMTYDVTPDIKLYVKPRRSGGSVVDLVFQFSSGVVYSVHVRYSGGIGRQYMDTEFGITPAFYNATEGLCGIMDNDVRNDFTGPAGKIYSKPKDFGDSCMENF